MKDKDDIMMRNFFSAQKQEIADNGFSKRVKKSLPYRMSPLVKMWGAIVLFVAIALFFIFDGWLAIIQSIRNIYVAMMQNTDLYADPKSYIIAVVVLAVIGISKVWSTE